MLTKQKVAPIDLQTLYRSQQLWFSDDSDALSCCQLSGVVPQQRAFILEKTAASPKPEASQTSAMVVIRISQNWSGRESMLQCIAPGH